MSSTSSSPTPASPPSNQPQSIYGFGSTYFYQLGGATPVELKHQNDDELDEPTVAAFHLTAPPWSNQNNSSHHNTTTNTSREDEVIIQDIQCTWTSSIFLTTKGKIYQTGTVHGKLTPTPRPIVIRLPLQVAQIAAGRHFCLAKMEGGLAVCSWGAGHFGQLGQGGKIALLQEPMVMERLLPHIIGAPIRQVAAGGWHGLAITTTGKLWAWGSNRRHQCGILPGSAIVNSSNCDTSSEASLSSTVAYPQPIHCAAEPNAVFGKVACGRAHSVALDEESGNVYCWGSSLYGQCGQSSRKTSVPSPKKVETLAQVHLVDVAAGEFHTLGLTGGGRVFSWGAGSEGQLGHGVSVTFGKPKLVGDLDFRSIMAGQDWKYHNLHSSMTGLHNTSMSSAAELSLRGGGATVASTTTTGTTDMPFDEGTNPNILANNSESSKRPARRNSNNAYTPSPIVQQPKPKVVGGGTVGSVAASSVAPSTEMMGEGSEHSYTIDTLLPVPPLSVDGTTKSGESSSFAVPRITSIHASGSYSAAISSTGHLYTWGYNDVGMLGLPIPNHLVNIENMNPKTSSLRQLQGCSFDSRHLVLLPRRVDALADVHVTGISTGPCHLWAWGPPRPPQQQHDDEPPQPTPSPLVGRTLYEVQETRRKKNLHRMRNTPSARALGGGGGGIGTQATIQEDIYFDGGNIVESPTYHQMAHHDMRQLQQQQASHDSSAGAIQGSPTKIAASLAVGGSTHSSTRSAPVGDSRRSAAAAAVDDHSVTTSPEKDSWRFSMGVGKVLRRFSNPRGNSFIEPKEKRPASKLRNTRFKEDVGGVGGIPALPMTTTNDAANPTTTTTTVTSAASVSSAASVQTDTPSKFLSRRQARSRSTPATSRTRSASRTTVSLGSRYRKNRKAQPPSLATDDGGGKSATEATTTEEVTQPQQQERRTNKKASSKATV